jgi:hypothetical protein
MPDEGCHWVGGLSRRTKIKMLGNSYLQSQPHLAGLLRGIHIHLLRHFALFGVLGSPLVAMEQLGLKFDIGGRQLLMIARGEAFLRGCDNTFCGRSSTDLSRS